MAQSRFTDPLANASTVGFIFMLIGLSKLLSSDFSPMNILIMVLYFVAGFGLWKKKLWSLYLFGGLAVYSILFFLYYVTQGAAFSLLLLLDPIIIGGLFAWFWKAKDRFSK